MYWPPLPAARPVPIRPGSNSGGRPRSLSAAKLGFPPTNDEEWRFTPARPAVATSAPSRTAAGAPVDTPAEIAPFTFGLEVAGCFCGRPFLRRNSPRCPRRAATSGRQPARRAGRTRPGIGNASGPGCRRRGDGFHRLEHRASFEDGALSSAPCPAKSSRSRCICFSSPPPANRARAPMSAI